MLARGQMEELRFVRMIRLVRHDHPCPKKLDVVKLAHSTRLVSTRAISRGGEEPRQPVNPAGAMLQTLRGLLTNQIGKRQRLVTRLCDFEQMINDVLFQRDRLEL